MYLKQEIQKFKILPGGAPQTKLLLPTTFDVTANPVIFCKNEHGLKLMDLTSMKEIAVVDLGGSEVIGTMGEDEKNESIRVMCRDNLGKLRIFTVLMES